MENTKTLQPRKVNSKTAIIGLTLFAIILRVIAYFGTILNNLISRFSDLTDYIFGCLFDGRNISIDVIERRLTFLLEHGFAIGDIIWSLFSVTFYMLMDVLPFALIIIYVAFLYKKSKATLIVPISFALLCLKNVINLIHTAIIYVAQDLSYVSSLEDLLNMATVSLVSILVTALTILPYVIVFILLTVGSLKGFNSKPLMIAPSVAGICSYIFFSLLAAFSNLMTITVVLLGNGNMSYSDMIINISLMGFALLTMLAFVAFFIAVIIFASKNYITEIIPISDAKLEKLIVRKPKQALEILKIRYETGKLSEEEYQEQIAKIDLNA